MISCRLARRFRGLAGHFMVVPIIRDRSLPAKNEMRRPASINFQTHYISGAQERFTNPGSYNIIHEMEKDRRAAEREDILLSYLSNPQVWNKYAYILNNPLKHTDPDGRRELTRGDEERIKKLQQYAIRAKHNAVGIPGNDRNLRARFATIE